MSITVVKFGGSSLKDKKCMISAVEAVKKEIERGNKTVVVVSARGSTTDKLIKDAKEITDSEIINPRELDALLSTGEQASAALFALILQANSIKSASLTGRNAGILTDSDFGTAKVLSVKPDNVEKLLDLGYTVVVAGFQGADEAGNVTTLGRGGSDTSAALLAVALSADKCKIYTDVDGVYTADPRKIPNAIKYDKISFREMLEFSNLGAKVLSHSSVQVAAKHKKPLTVLSAQGSGGSTVVCSDEDVSKNKISGITTSIINDMSYTSVVCLDVIENPKIAFEAQKHLADNNIPCDQMIIRKDSFSLLTNDSQSALRLLHDFYFLNK